MHDSYLLLTPVAVLAIVVLFGFVGCQLIFKLEAMSQGPYTVEIGKDAPVAWWRLQEQPASPFPPVKDETGNHNGVFFVAANAIADDPATLSPSAQPPLLELGVLPSLLATDATATCVRMQGALAGAAFQPALNSAQFTFEALCSPEWAVFDPQTLGRYYCLVESSDQPAVGSTTSKSRGFAIYAGPDDPATPNSPYRWQLWVGDGTGFRQVKEATPVPNATNPGPVVEQAPMYVAVTFDGTTFNLWVYAADRDIDAVKFVLAPQSFVPNDNGDLTIGMAGARRSLVAPFPGPGHVLYPFAGRIEEVAVYDSALIEERIISHIMSAFNA